MNKPTRPFVAGLRLRVKEPRGGAKGAKPRYKHDCDQCQYLGTIYYPAPHYRPDASGAYNDCFFVMKHADLYFCAGCEEGTCITRFSSRGSDYASRPVWLSVPNQSGYSTAGPALETARLFATVKGLIKGDKS
jgi:hypothetical protein